jgi:hypothetical protein
MDSAEAQMRAIKLSSAQREGEAGAHMDTEGRVHTCPNCGHEMPMDDILGHEGGERLTSADKRGLGGAHMDREGNLG